MTVLLYIAAVADIAAVAVAFSALWAIVIDTWAQRTGEQP